MTRRLRFLDRLTAALATLTGFTYLLMAALDRPQTRVGLAISGVLIATLAARIVLATLPDREAQP